MEYLNCEGNVSENKEKKITEQNTVTSESRNTVIKFIKPLLAFLLELAAGRQNFI